MPFTVSCRAIRLLLAIAVVTHLHVAHASDSRTASSQPVEDANRLPTVVVTATRTEEALADVPATVQVVTETEITEAMFRSVPEILRETPGVMVQKTGYGQGSPYIRGFTGFRTLFLIDGIRLNNSVFRDGPNQYWNTVDPFSIERMEIVKGPGSALYGSDAIGGTVNVISKGPGTWGDGDRYAGRGYYRYATAEHSNTGRAEGTATDDYLFGLYGGGTYKDYGDLRSADGRQNKTGYTDTAGDFKLQLNPYDDFELTLAAQAVHQDDAWRTHKTIYGQPFQGTDVGSELQRSLDQERHLYYARVNTGRLNRLMDSSELTVSYQSQEEERDRIRSDGRLDEQGIDVDTVGLLAQFGTTSSIGDWTWGVEYYHDSVDSFRRDYNADGSSRAKRIQGPVGDDADYDLFGAYVQDDVWLSERLQLLVGGRYTWANAKARNVEDPVTGNRISVNDDWNHLTGSVRALYWLDDAQDWSVFGGVASAFRAPNLSDLTRFDSARSNEIETPSPDLDPEKFLSFELGTRVSRRSTDVQAAVFYTDIRDMIERFPTGDTIDGDTVITKDNVGDGWIYGLEVSASHRFMEDFTARGWLSWQRGKSDTYPDSTGNKESEWLSRLAPLQGLLALRWDAPGDRWLEGLMRYADDATRLSTRDEADTQRIPRGGTPDYTVFDLRGGLRPNRYLTVTAAVENITDKFYRVHGSGVNEAGRNFVIGIDLAL